MIIANAIVSGIGVRYSSAEHTRRRAAANGRTWTSISGMQHQHTPEEERTIREAALDETLEATFPASDPPSSNPNPDDHDAVEPEAPPADKSAR